MIVFYYITLKILKLITSFKYLGLTTSSYFPNTADFKSIIKNNPYPYYAH